MLQVQLKEVHSYLLKATVLFLAMRVLPQCLLSKCIFIVSGHTGMNTPQLEAACRGQGMVSLWEQHREVMLRERDSVWQLLRFPECKKSEM